MVSRETSPLESAHRRLLERFRNSMNLVGPGPIEPQFEDCHKALARLEPRGRWVDLGTGAGFPGLVFAARFPEVPIDLVDSRAKRCWFLEQVLAEVPSPLVQVQRCRHEQLEPGYDGVLSRALHAPERMVDVARRLLNPGGTLVLFLQDEHPIPSELEVFHVEHYVVDGRRRKSVTASIPS